MSSNKSRIQVFVDNIYDFIITNFIKGSLLKSDSADIFVNSMPTKFGVIQNYEQLRSLKIGLRQELQNKHKTHFDKQQHDTAVSSYIDEVCDLIAKGRDTESIDFKTNCKSKTRKLISSLSIKPDNNYTVYIKSNDYGLVDGCNSIEFGPVKLVRTFNYDRISIFSIEGSSHFDISNFQDDTDGIVGFVWVVEVCSGFSPSVEVAENYIHTFLGCCKVLRFYGISDSFFYDRLSDPIHPWSTIPALSIKNDKSNALVRDYVGFTEILSPNEHRLRSHYFKKWQSLAPEILSYSTDSGNLSQHIGVSLNWYNRALTEKNSGLKISYYVFAIESLLSSSQTKTETTNTIARAAASINSNNNQERLIIFKTMVEVYSSRSQIVHGSSLYSGDKVINDARSIARNMLYNVMQKCDLNQKHTDFMSNLMDSTHGIFWGPC